MKMIRVASSQQKTEYNTTHIHYLMKFRRQAFTATSESTKNLLLSYAVVNVFLIYVVIVEALA